MQPVLDTNVALQQRGGWSARPACLQYCCLLEGKQKEGFLYFVACLCNISYATHPHACCWTCRSTQALTWAVIPVFQGYVVSGAFTIAGRLKTSLQKLQIFYLVMAVLSVIGGCCAAASAILVPEAFLAHFNVPSVWRRLDVFDPDNQCNIICLITVNACTWPTHAL